MTLARLRARLGNPLEWSYVDKALLLIGVGINTGTATVGNFDSAARMDYTAVGNQVNLAARLEARCEPGGILISHATWGLVHEEIPCIAKGEIEVKGLHYPVKVYEVVLER